MSFMIMDMLVKYRVRHVAGKCAHCGVVVWEALVRLDDAYAVWAGRCPHCQGINLLTTRQGRGYHSSGMTLVKPTAEEIAEYPELAPTVQP